MKRDIVNWIVKWMFKFIMAQKCHRITMSIVYYYKGESVKIVRTDLMSRHVNWLKNAMANNPLDPPGNWDCWKIENK